MCINLPVCRSYIITCKAAREGNCTLNTNEWNIFHTTLVWVVLVLSLIYYDFLLVMWENSFVLLITYHSLSSSQRVRGENVGRTSIRLSMGAKGRAGDSLCASRILLCWRSCGGDVLGIRFRTTGGER